MIFDHMMQGMIPRKKLKATVAKFAIKGRKFNISVVFIYTILFCSA